MNNKSVFPLIVFICTSIQFFASAQPIEEVAVLRQPTRTINLSELSSATQAIVLENDQEDPVERIIYVGFADNNLLVVDSDDPDKAFPVRLSLFSKDGQFIKTIGKCTRVTIDQENKVIYTLSGDKLYQYDFDGNSLLTFEIGKGTRNIQFYNGLVWMSHHTTSNNMPRVYALKTLDPTTGIVKKLKSFSLAGSDKVGNISIGAHSRFMVGSSGFLYYTFGFEQHFYKIGRGNKVENVKVSFSEMNRTYFDKVLTHFGLVNNYLYCSFDYQEKKHFYFQSLHDKTSITTQNGIQDDIYGTGTLKARTTLNNNWLFDVRYGFDLEEELLTKHEMEEHNILIIIGKGS